jgi:hypothetical protein
MVSKYIIGALLFGAASASGHSLKKDEKYFEHAFHLKEKMVEKHNEHHEAKKDLKELVKEHYCPTAQNQLCQYSYKITNADGSEKDQFHLMCMSSKINDVVYAKDEKITFDQHKFTINEAYTNKEFDKNLECLKTELLLDANEIKFALAEKKTLTKEEDKKSPEGETLCVVMTKTEEGEKKEVKRDVKYFTIKLKDFEFKGFTNESLKKLQEELICQVKDEDVVKKGEAFEKGESESTCSKWWWLLVIPVVGGIGAGAYYALKEEDDDVSEYDCEA